MCLWCSSCGSCAERRQRLNPGLPLMSRACLNRKQDLFRHLADKGRSQPLDVRRRFSSARDSFNRAQKDRRCKTQLSSGDASSSGKGSSGGSTACTCGGQTR